eukprot:7099747-Alexandrium_andersonii.AAC.1
MQAARFAEMIGKRRMQNNSCRSAAGGGSRVACCDGAVADLGHFLCGPGRAIRSATAARTQAWSQ